MNSNNSKERLLSSIKFKNGFVICPEHTVGQLQHHGEFSKRRAISTAREDFDLRRDGPLLHGSLQELLTSYHILSPQFYTGVPKTKTNSQLHKTMGTQKAIAKAFLGKLALEIVLVLVLSQYGNKFPPLLLEFLQGKFRLTSIPMPLVLIHGHRFLCFLSHLVSLGAVISSRPQDALQHNEMLCANFKHEHGVQTLCWSAFWAIGETRKHKTLIDPSKMCLYVLKSLESGVKS